MIARPVSNLAMDATSEPTSREVAQRIENKRQTKSC